MKEKIKVVVGLLFAAAFVAQADQLQTNQRDSDKTYGAAHGFAIDFDSSAANRATATPVLTNGVTYSLDDVAVRVATGNNKFGATRNSYLGVYTSIANDGTLGGFLGASDSAVTLAKNSGKNYKTWSFSNIDVTVDDVKGAGSGLLYFVFQLTDSALPTLVTTATAYTSLIRDNNNGAGMDRDLAAIVRGDSANKVITARNPLYTAHLTAIPEPATLGLIAVMAGGLLFVRRRIMM